MSRLQSRFAALKQENRAALVTFTLGHVNPQDLATLLDQSGLAIRSDEQRRRTEHLNQTFRQVIETLPEALNVTSVPVVTPSAGVAAITATGRSASLLLLLPPPPPQATSTRARPSPTAVLHLVIRIMGVVLRTPCCGVRPHPNGLLGQAPKASSAQNCNVMLSRAVRPGDQLVINAKLTKSRGGKIGVAEATCTVGGNVVSSAELMFGFVDIEADVCIVGGGFTGLWSAIALKQAEPALRILVLEKDRCGSGASGLGREGGMEAMRFFTEPRNVCIAT